MTKYIVTSALILISSVMSSKVKASNDLIQVSQNFLYALQNGEPTEDCKKDLAAVDFSKLVTKINTDDKRKAFWINIYNAFIMDLLKENPELYLDRGAFFKAKQINIAGRMISFDDIEHGIIRRSVNKYSFGFIPNIFISKFERKLRTDKRDGRVHFALNCGAKSCPKVAIYESAKINSQLDAIAKQFLTNTTNYNKAEKTAFVTALISWFRGDFGGIEGAKKMMVEYGVIESTEVKLEFDDYDWTLLLFNFTEI